MNENELLSNKLLILDSETRYYSAVTCEPLTIINDLLRIGA